MKITDTNNNEIKVNDILICRNIVKKVVEFPCKCGLSTFDLNTGAGVDLDYFVTQCEKVYGEKPEIFRALILKKK